MTTYNFITANGNIANAFGYNGKSTDKQIYKISVDENKEKKILLKFIIFQSLPTYVIIHTDEVLECRSNLQKG